MLVTWNACMQNAPAQGGLPERWRAFLDRLSLAAPANYDDRVRQAVDYITQIDEVVEGWAGQNGA